MWEKVKTSWSDSDIDEIAKKRVVRFGEMPPSRTAFIDMFLPKHSRDFFNVIGAGVTEDPNMPTFIPNDGHDFNIAYLRSKPGERSGLHYHATVEVFIPLTGRWTFMLGEKEQKEVTLEPFDVISIPPGVYRAFRNDGDKDAWLIGILGGQDAGKVKWANKVLDDAKQLGWELDENQNLRQVKRSQVEDA